MMCIRQKSAILAQGEGHTFQTEDFVSFLVTLIVALGSVKNLNIKFSCASFCSSGT